MHFTKSSMGRLTVVLGLGALLLTTAPASAKSKGHGGKGHSKWQKHYDKRERKEEKRWAKQERKEAKRWEKENRRRADWDDDRDWSDRDRDWDRRSSGGSDWWRQYLSGSPRR